MRSSPTPASRPQLPPGGVQYIVHVILCAVLLCVYIYIYIYIMLLFLLFSFTQWRAIRSARGAARHGTAQKADSDSGTVMRTARHECVSGDLGGSQGRGSEHRST